MVKILNLVIIIKYLLIKIPIYLFCLQKDIINKYLIDKKMKNIKINDITKNY